MGGRKGSRGNESEEGRVGRGEEEGEYCECLKMVPVSTALSLRACGEK
jgi:hypothetical protein